MEKIKKTQQCSSRSLPSASILSKIKLIARRQILKSCYQKPTCFSGSLILKLTVFLHLMCMRIQVCLRFSTISSKYQNHTKKTITLINSTYILNNTQISEQARPQFLTSASLTFPAFSKKYCKEMWMLLNIFEHLEKIRILLLQWLHSSTNRSL